MKKSNSSTFNVMQYRLRRWLRSIGSKTVLKKKTVIIFLSISLSIISINVLHSFRNGTPYSLLMLKNYFEGKGYVGYIQYQVTTHIDNNRLLNIEIAVPYTKTRQAEVLVKNKPRIKHEFIISMCESENREAISNRHFSDIRELLIQIINRFTCEPVETIYYKKLILL